MRRVYSRPMLDGVVGWPPEFAHRYRARGYWAGTTIGQAWDRAAGANADRVAVVDGARRGTYRALSALVDRLPRPPAHPPRVGRRLPPLPQGRRTPGPLPARRARRGGRGPGEAHGVGGVVRRRRAARRRRDAPGGPARRPGRGAHGAGLARPPAPPPGGRPR